MNGNNSSNMLQPVLISGILFGVITAIPPFSFINACTCCSLFAASGFTAGFLYKRSCPEGLTSSKGAILGLFTGIIGGIAHTAISLPIAFILQKIGGSSNDIAEKIGDILGDKNAEVASMLRQILENSQGLGVLFIAIKLISSVFFFTVFGILGGILASALLKKGTPAVAPSDAYSPPLPPTPPPPITYYPFQQPGEFGGNASEAPLIRSDGDDLVKPEPPVPYIKKED